MRGIVSAIVANDLDDWPQWEPIHPADEVQWFTVYIRSSEGGGSDSFQVAVATPQGLTERRGKTPFVGLVVRALTPACVEAAIQTFVARVEATTWAGLAEQLAPTMVWEFTDYRPA